MISELPVIDSGLGIPIICNSVGAIADKLPPFAKALVFLSITMQGTGYKLCWVWGSPVTGFTISSQLP
jgi:hypothetical protein